MIVVCCFITSDVMIHHPSQPFSCLPFRLPKVDVQSHFWQSEGRQLQPFKEVIIVTCQSVGTVPYLAPELILGLLGWAVL